MNLLEYSRVYAEIDLDAIRHNMEQMKQKLAADTKIIGVIKTDGYGHGAIPIAKELSSLPYLEGFAVATAEEALILRQAGIEKPLLILGYTFPYSYERLIENDIQITVFRKDMLKQLSQYAQKVGKKSMVHIKVDTGMTRIGITPDEEGLTFVKEVLSTKDMELTGIFTHFARADEKDKGPVLLQLQRFMDFRALVFLNTGYHVPLWHCSNSAGIVELKEANLDVVRAGITMYGLWPSEDIDKTEIDLQPAMALKSHIVFIKEIEAGVPVSYGGTFVTKKKTKLATIPVGYGDGYPRGCSNKGYVLVRGQKAPVTGRVCMDQFMVDVTEVEGVMEGDLVTLIGTDQTASVSMEEISALSGRFHYELACCVGKRVPRVYLKERTIIETKDYFNDF